MHPYGQSLRRPPNNSIVLHNRKRLFAPPSAPVAAGKVASPWRSGGSPGVHSKPAGLAGDLQLARRRSKDMVRQRRPWHNAGQSGHAGVCATRQTANGQPDRRSTAMELLFPFGAQGEDGLQVLWEDGERVFCRGSRPGADGKRTAVLAVLPAAEHPSPTTVARFAHEYGLKDELDGGWAARPLESCATAGGSCCCWRTRAASRSNGCSMADGSGALPAACHRHGGRLGRDARGGPRPPGIEPANILVSSTTGEVRLTEFGIASAAPGATGARSRPIAYALPTAPEQPAR